VGERSPAGILGKISSFAGGKRRISREERKHTTGMEYKKEGLLIGRTIISFNREKVF